MALPEARPRTVWDVAAERARRSPDSIALTDLGAATETFSEIVERAERVAAGLLDHGVGPGSAVSWQLPTTRDAVVLMLALARLGAVQNPLVTVYRARELTSVLDQLKPSLFVTLPHWRGFDHEAMVSDLLSGRDGVSALIVNDSLPEGDPSRLPEPPSSAEDVRWIYTTSGTTAQPKCVRHCDRAITMAGAVLMNAGGFTSQDIGSMPFPLAHIGGPMTLSAFLQAGVPMVLIDPFTPDTAVDALRRVGATLVGGGTAHTTALVNEQLKAPHERLLPTLRAIVTGGGPKPPSLFFDAVSVLGARNAHGYGMTECLYLSVGTVTDTDEQLANTDGRPPEGTEISIRDPEGRDLATGETGEIHVRSPLLCLGYLDDALTAASFDADGFFRTGDLGRLRADGHLQVTGRLKDVIIRKGENVSALDVELVLCDMPGVADVAVIGLPDVERGERVCAVVELEPGAPTPTLAAVRDHCVAKGLMMQKIPEQLEVVDSLPRTAFLKVAKAELRKVLG